MPQPNHPPKHEPSYRMNALGTLAKRGVTQLEFWCPICRRYSCRDMKMLLARFDPATDLQMLARKARCGGCGRRGCHIQPADPPAQGTPGYREWLGDEMARCQAFLTRAREQL